MPMRLRAGHAFSFLALLAPLFGFACDAGRFPICKSDAECTAEDAGTDRKVCFNLRCVQCRYDDDCKSGEVCNRTTNECNRLDPVGPEEQKAANVWEPKTWDECAKDCKDEGCIKDCDARFRK